MPKGTGQVPLDLTHHIYLGMSETVSTDAAKAIANANAGRPIVGRIDLVVKLHAAINAKIELGTSSTTVRNICKSLRYFFAWCDREGRMDGEASALVDFLAWAEFLMNRALGRAKLPIAQSDASGLRKGAPRLAKIKPETALDIASFASSALTAALGMERPAIRYTRLPALAAKARTPYNKSEKTSFEDASRAGAILLQICDQLTIERIRSPLPVEIKLDSGHVFTEWCKLQPPGQVKALLGLRSPAERSVVERARLAWQEDGTVRTRYVLTNLRIECELLIFLSQTGMNLAQAHQIGRTRFRFKTLEEDIVVDGLYKARKGGEVEFTIYREYRKIFNRYLEWLDAFVPIEEDDRLFPFYYPSAIPPEGSAPNLSSTRLRFKQMGVPFVGPQRLRNLRVNWFRVRANDALAAEVAQHTVSTLRNVYAKPSHPVAASEISRFHNRGEVACDGPAAGSCAGAGSGPKAIHRIPDGVARPDCISPSGCMFCDHHRDVSTFDYAWSLVTYLHLKILELASHTPTNRKSVEGKTPIESTVDRIVAKADAFAASSEKRQKWIEESKDRMRERNFHPSWSTSILMMD